MNDRKVDRDQHHIIEQKRQFEQQVLQAVIEQNAKGVVEPIVKGVLTVVNQPSFTHGVEAAIQEGRDEYHTLAMETISIHSEKLNIFSEVKVIDGWELCIRFGIEDPTADVSKNQSAYKSWMNGFIVVRIYNFTLSSLPHIDVTSWSGTHQDYSGKGFAVALTMCSHEVIRSVLATMEHRIGKIESCRGIITDIAEASLLQKPRQDWSTSMAKTLGFHSSDQGKSNEFIYEYI